MKNSEFYRNQEARYYMQVVNRLAPVLVKGDGVVVEDADGKRYLDFTAGWATLNMGHSHPDVTAAVRAQAGRIMQMANVFYTAPQLELARILVDNSCFDRVFFCNSGAEANEGACKLARKWGRLKLNGAYEIITALNSFHGRTLAMTAATGQPSHQEKWRPLTPGFVNVPFNDLEAVRNATNSRTCAVLVEPVQGEGGVNVPDADYLSGLQKWCVERDILFMVDEVQTGMGRLGALFGYQRFEGVEPDVMTLGKALGAGAPLGAFLCKERFAVLEPGDHGSTFGGNALTTAAGAAGAQALLSSNAAKNARVMGERLRQELNALKEEFGDYIRESRGMGLLIAVELARDDALQIVKWCIEEGLLVNAVRPNLLRLMPPLVVSQAQVSEAARILARVFKKARG